MIESFISVLRALVGTREQSMYSGGESMLCFGMVDKVVRRSRESHWMGKGRVGEESSERRAGGLGSLASRRDGGPPRWPRWRAGRAPSGIRHRPQMAPQLTGILRFTPGNGCGLEVVEPLDLDASGPGVARATRLREKRRRPQMAPQPIGILRFAPGIVALRHLRVPHGLRQGGAETSGQGAGGPAVTRAARLHENGDRPQMVPQPVGILRFAPGNGALRRSRGRRGP